MINILKKIANSNKYIYSFLTNRSLIIFLYKKYNFIKLKQVVKFSQINKENRNIFLLLEQEHGNLGDIALGYARKKFIQDFFPEFNIIGITEREYNHYGQYIKKIVKPNDIITLIGGGSLGNQYLEHENSRRSIIGDFKDNMVISFPQSMYFTPTEEGKKELKISEDIYSTNRNLVLVARDPKSYELMKDSFINSKILLTPDIVLYLNETNPKRERSGALALIRSDVESILSNDQREYIFSLLKGRYNNVTITDTVVNRSVLREKADEELTVLFEMIKKSELVITDRLHGMVFAAITSTPCVVLSNYNHKIKAQYEWIKHLNYIKFLDDLSDIEKTIQDLNKTKPIDYNNDYVKKHFQQLIDEISGT